ncbi:MAG: mannonate dehydratase [Propionibacteriaceae bacterium]|jgi:mannonate dehydratase|nr:mannonate dehydratase [Propionibacteriaceae bacterium]
MKFGFRWFGAQDDPIPLRHIRQIPGVSHVVGALFDIPVGEVWPAERVGALKAEVEAAGLRLEVVESVNVHDAIKIGLPERDRRIANYIQTIKNLSAHGVKVICYNFMPVFDWFRTELRHELPDGSFGLALDSSQVPDSVEVMVERVRSRSGGFSLPGWEPERLADVRALLEAYADVDDARLAANFEYFIQAIIPTCEAYGVRMAVHPDDPPWPLLGLPRIVKDAADLRRVESFHDSPYNGFTLCSGSLAENPANNVPAIIREFVGRDKVPFVHLRNIKHTGAGSFHESAHLSSEGSLDMYEVVRALADNDFDGYARSDHGRDIWGERGRPGYGLNDRALGSCYLNGLWEAITKAGR